MTHPTTPEAAALAEEAKQLARKLHAYEDDAFRRHYLMELLAAIYRLALTQQPAKEAPADLMLVVEQILDAGHMNQEDLARLRAAWEASSPAAAPAPQAEQVGDNWQQYAGDGETAQACIERHRREHDALLSLLAKERAKTLPRPNPAEGAPQPPGHNPVA